MIETLDNGLTVIFEESHIAPVVAIQAWVKVGSADETDDEAGLAHFHEHMLFKGTKKRGVGVVAKEIEGIGGQINAWTSFDETVYHTVLPSSEFEQGLDIIADMLQHSSFDAQEIIKESKVILEELARSQDSPYQKLNQETFALSFQKHHYRRPIVGYEKNIKNFTRDDLLTFYKKWYSPKNIIIVVTGDIDKKRLKREIQKQFADFPSIPVKHQRLSEPIQEEIRLKNIHDHVHETYLQLAFPIPNLHHDDLYALELLTVLFGQGESSRLEISLRRPQLVNSISSISYTPIDAGLLFISATMPLDNQETVLSILFDEINKLKQTLSSRQELKKARTVVESDAIYGRETMQGLARTLGYYQTMTGDLHFEKRFYERISQVTIHDIQHVAQRYLDINKANFVFLTPYAHSQPDITKEKILSLFHQSKKKFPIIPKKEHTKAKNYTLSNGIRIILKETHHTPLISIRAVMNAGLRVETRRNNGIGHLTSRLITQGTTHHTAEDIHLIIDEMAASLSGLSGNNSLGLQGDFLSQSLDEGLELFLECLLSPSFPEEELEREKYFILEELRSIEDQAGSLAVKLFHQTLFRKHPYKMMIQGTKTTIPRISRTQIKRFYKKLLRPSNLVLSLVGDFNSQEMLVLLETKLGNLKEHEVKPVNIPQEPSLKKRRIKEAHTTHQQAHILFGFLGTTLYSQDRYPITLLNAILAGQGGRLFIHLREKLSLAYSISSYSVELVDPGYFAIYIATNPNKIEEAIKAIKEELKLIQTELVSQEELERVKRSIIGNYSISFQRNGTQALNYALHTVYGQDIEEVDNYPQRIGAITSKQIQEIAQKYLTLDAYTLIITKPNDKQEPTQQEDATIQ